ncbi:hypothetical protein NP493_8975g00002 [Ridgeia piscesae]|uniref:Uncharacterized protein n=1 Tax=Ridgeia piscesae TaxID=27915 RepID=A0AAD9MPE6_RIDPI|nr:hypothetical protein NP493_8975g00002 [Ridgeia piscesae]
MTPEIIQSKRHRRYLESVWRKSRSSLDSYGNAYIKFYTGDLLLLYQPMQQSSHCINLFLIILKTKPASYIQLSQIILQTLLLTLHN